MALKAHKYKVASAQALLRWAQARSTRTAIGMFAMMLLGSPLHHLLDLYWEGSEFMLQHPL
jgi:hypothetical protein